MLVGLSVKEYPQLPAGSAQMSQQLTLSMELLKG